MPISGEEEHRAIAEAARWLLALEDAPHDPTQRAHFEAWMAASPSNAAAWENSSAIYKLMGKVPPAHAAAWVASTARRGEAGVRRGRRSLAGVLAAAAVAGLVFFMAPALLIRLQADYVTATAELRSLRLEDGSIVHLGGDSAVAVAFAEGERRVTLLEGSAFFEVMPDANRVFRVVARDVETTALGTAFEVGTKNDAVAVAVRQGHVRVDYGGATESVSERLAAGDWISVGPTGHVERRDILPGDVASWLQGQIIANDRPLAEVVDELRGYYRGTILFADDQLGLKRVTGVYNVSDPVSALRALAGAHGGTVQQISPWLLVLGSG